MLTDQQVQSFHDNGFLVMKGLLPPEEIDRLRSAADRLQERAMAAISDEAYLADAKRLNKDWIEHPEDHFVYREKPDGRLSFHRIERMFTQDPAFARVAMDPRLLENVWQALGERPFWPRGGSLVVKLPHEGAAVRWHQDIPYLYWSSGGHPSHGRPATHPVPNFTTDIYLEPSTEDNGCLWALPGTHKHGSVDVDQLVAEHGFDLPGAVPLVAEPGDVVFHHVAVVHGSPANRSATTRRTFYIHYMNDATVADAYSDWPDLLSAEQAVEFWGARLSGRISEPMPTTPLEFKVTSEGLQPALAPAA